MNLQDLLEAADAGQVSLTERDPEFPAVLALLDGPADAMFGHVLRGITTSSDGKIGRCTSVTISGGLSTLGKSKRAALRGGA